MRCPHLFSAILLGLLWTGATGAEENEVFVLRDGREVVGRYDDSTGQLQVRGKGSIKATMTVAPGDIVRRSPWTDPKEEERNRAAATIERREAERMRSIQVEAMAAKEREAAAKEREAAAKAARQAQEDERARVAEVRAQEQAAANQAKAIERARYWDGLGLHFDPARLSAEEMDRVGFAEAEARERQQAMEKENDQAATVRQIVAKSVSTPDTLVFFDLKPVHFDPATGERVWRVEFDSLNAFGVQMRTRLLLPWYSANGGNSAIWSFDPVGLALTGDATPRSIRQALTALRKARMQTR